MSGLSSVLLSGLSGLRTSQTGLSVVSQNIANANTPGYVRAEVTLAPQSHIGAGGGVEVTAIKRAADRFLAAASYFAEAGVGAASVRASLLERAQSSFGDPASDSTMFAMLDQFWTALSEVSVDPSSSLRRTDVVAALETMYTEIRRVGETVQGLIAEADQRIADGINQAQSLIDRIAALNNEIRITKATEADVTSAENAQAALIDELSALIDIRVTLAPDGGVVVRTGGGALLVGFEAARLSYTPTSSPFAAHDTIGVNEHLGAQSNIEQFLLGGEIKGLLQARDEDLVGLAEALGGFAGELADAINQVHNENASSPAVSSLTGRQTGLLGTDAIGFSGNAIVAVTGVGGDLLERLTIDFDAQTITAEAPAGVYSFAGGTVDDFVASLNAALGAATPAGSASFTGGVLSVSVPGGGVVVQQDPADPSARAGRGFSHFFGLNDVISRPTPLFFQSGVQGSDAHGLNAGGEITYRVRDSAGRLVADRTISISGPLAGAGSDWDALITALNAPGTGVGGYGAFALDPATGRISFSPISGYEVELLGDTTQRGATGVSFSALHGLSQASSAARAMELRVDAEVANNPARLAIGRPDLTVAIGEQVIEGGDNRGAAALLAARDSVRSFPAAGLLVAQTATLASYASRLGGEAGRLASGAQRQAQGAKAIAAAANDRRAQVESVSIDDELMKMTTFQNAYAAAARVIQAATDMLDVLMSIGYRS